MTEVLGEFSVELDGRFDSIRKRETNLGNWVSLILCIYMTLFLTLCSDPRDIYY